MTPPLPLTWREFDPNRKLYLVVAEYGLLLLAYDPFDEVLTRWIN